MHNFCYAQAGDENEKAKIAVAAESDLDGVSVSLRAARARFILIFDDKGNLVESHAYPMRSEKQAGPELAAWLAGKNVKIFISGNVGRNLSRSLEFEKITWIETSGSVAMAVKNAID
jgi:predicted Fe-Mo cluster-binding NifX family protein